MHYFTLIWISCKLHGILDYSVERLRIKTPVSVFCPTYWTDWQSVLSMWHLFSHVKFSLEVSISLSVDWISGKKMLFYSMANFGIFFKHKILEYWLHFSLLWLLGVSTKPVAKQLVFNQFKSIKTTNNK